MRIVIAGDYCDRGRVSQFLRQKNYSVLFDEVKDLVKSSDFGIVNFEFPIISQDADPIKKCGPCLQGHKEAIEAIKYAGFNVCTLANNHILDQGEKCCIGTKSMIEDFGISTVGAGRNLEEAGRILYLKRNDETLAIINCCEHEFSIATTTTAGANPLNTIQQYYKISEAKENADYVIVIVHGGHETCQLPSPRMVETYRYFIDIGADIVVNHHQHCYSGFEEYKGKPIFYGLGNFLFDNENQRNTNWNEGFLLELNLNKEQSSFFIHPYVQCNERELLNFMDVDAKECFWKRIHGLNKIIEDETKLVEAHRKWIIDHKGAFLNIFQPYNSWLTQRLFRRGLLPSFVNNCKRLQIINYVNCESHLDKLRLILNNL